MIKSLAGFYKGPPECFREVQKSPWEPGALSKIFLGEILGRYEGGTPMESAWLITKNFFSV